MNSTPKPRALPENAGDKPANEAPSTLQEEPSERLAVLSDDALLNSVLQRISAPHEVLAFANDVELAKALRESPAAVAVIDSAFVGRTPLERVTARLKLQFPDLILLVLGEPQDQAALADQLARGTVYRFLPKPIPPQRLKHFIDGAWLRHEEAMGEILVVTPSEQPKGAWGGGKWTAKRWLAAGGLLLAVLAAGTWTVRKLVMAPEPPPQALAPVAPESPVDDLLSRADAALAAGGFENAADLYHKAQQMAPGDPHVAQDIKAGVRRLLAASQTQLLERHIERAQALAKVAIDLDPDNPQVAALVKQIMEDSASPAAADASTTRPLDAEARKARLEESLRHAQDLMRQGHLLEPAQDSARAALARAREIAPSDPRLRQEQRALLEMLLAEGRKALAAGHADDAERYVAPAQELGARAEEIASLQPPRPAAPPRESADRIIAQFNERLQQGKLVDPAGDSAKSYLAQLVKNDPNSAATQIAKLALGQRLVAEAESAARQKDGATMERWLTEGQAVGVDNATLANVRAILAAAQAGPAPQPKAPVEQPVLYQVRNVEADYPANAQSMRLKGYVQLRFTVRTDGTTADIAVISSKPVGFFEQAAIDAVRKWRYRPPVLKDGTPAEAHAEIKLNFAP